MREVGGDQLETSANVSQLANEVVINNLLRGLDHGLAFVARLFDSVLERGRPKYGELSGSRESARI